MYVSWCAIRELACPKLCVTEVIPSRGTRTERYSTMICRSRVVHFWEFLILVSYAQVYLEESSVGPLSLPASVELISVLFELWLYSVYSERIPYARYYSSGNSQLVEDLWYVLDTAPDKLDVLTFDNAGFSMPYFQKYGLRSLVLGIEAAIVAFYVISRISYFDTSNRSPESKVL